MLVAQSSTHVIYHSDHILQLSSNMFCFNNILIVRECHQGLPTFLPSIRTVMQPCSAALWLGSIATQILYIQYLCNKLWYWAFSTDCTTSFPLLLTRDSLILTYQVLCLTGTSSPNIDTYVKFTLPHQSTWTLSKV